jgi:acid phosphatase
MAAMLSACATQPSTVAKEQAVQEVAKETAKQGVPPDRNPLLMATLWWQVSSEALAASTQTYTSAKRALDRALVESPKRSAALEQKSGFDSKPPAVVMDLDETVLDNGRQQGELIRRGEIEYSAPLWDQWLHLQQAAAVPGAIGFIRYAQRHGVRVFFVSNRECKERQGATDKCPQQKDTAENLRKLGVQSATLDEDLMLKNERPEWKSEKQGRRELIAANYRIVLLLGDDLGDFIADVKAAGITPEQRREITRSHCSYWGDRWFFVPNPMYGSWEQTLAQPKPSYIQGFPTAAGVPVPEDCDES